MKRFAILTIALGFAVSNYGYSGITRLKNKGDTHEKSVAKHGSKEAEILTEIRENNKRIGALLQGHSSLPVIWEQNSEILTGRAFHGALLNSINSTNQSSPILVLAHPNQGLPPKTKFSCQGVTKNERVFTLCNKMVTPEKEITIQAQVLNIDGTSGLVGEFDDGKEDYIAGAILSDFAKGVFSAAQSRLSSPLGAIRDDSVKNQILQGAIESGQTTSEILLEEMKTKEPVVTIDAGTEVLIYFMEAINVK